MSNPLSVQKFLASDTAKIAREDLMKMMDDPGFNTTSTYSPSSEERMLFVDKHMKYLGQHPNLNPQHYLSNLRLMTRIK
jgi:hypothetical protein